MSDRHNQGFSFGLPGSRYVKTDYARMLARQNLNNGSTAGGIGHVLQQALLGYMQGSEREKGMKAETDQTAAYQAMTQGMSAKPWNNPDAGGQPMIPDAPGSSSMVPTAPAGGYEGGVAALQGLQDNPAASRLASRLSIGMAEHEQARRAAELARTQGLDDYETKLKLGQKYAVPKERKIIQGADGYQYFADTGERALPNVQKPQEQPFAGNSMDAQARNILLSKEPSSPEYAAAFSYLSEAKTTVDPKTGGITTIAPDMSAFAPPAMRQGMPQPIAQGGQQPTAQGAHSMNVPGATVTRTDPPMPRDQKAIDDAQYSIKLVDDLLSHPGMKDVVGMPESISGAATKLFDTPIPGTDAAGFMARLDQLGGRQFLEAYGQLKGGGQITEVEGKQATNALSRLQQTGQSEKEYRAAAEELQSILKRGLERAGGGQPEAQQRRRVVRNPQTGKLEMMPQGGPVDYGNPLPTGQGDQFERRLRP